MMGDPVLSLACICAVAAVAILRLAWSRPQRSAALNGAGWGLVLASLVAGWAAAGAWGASVASLWTMGAAFVALAHAGIVSRPSKAQASNRRVGMLPEHGEPLRLPGRLLTFVLVTFACALFAAGAALAACALALTAGWLRADAYVLAFFLMPLAWAGIAYAVLMQPARRAQLKVLALASLPTWPLLATGLIA
jgi:hypothetical protein